MRQVVARTSKSGREAELSSHRTGAQPYVRSVPSQSDGASVLMITSEYPPDRGGVADYTYNLVRALSNDGVHVHTVVVIGQTRRTDGATPGVSVERRPRRWGTWLHLLAAVRRRKSRVIHLQYVPQGYGRGGVALYLVLFAAMLRLVTRTRLVITMHELWVPLSPHPARLLVGLLQRVQTLALAAMSHVTIVTNAVNWQRLTILPRPIRPLLQQVPVGSNVPVSTQPSARVEAILQSMPPSSAILAVFSPLTIGKAFRPLLDVLEALPEVSLLCIGGLSDAERVRATSLSRDIAQRGLAQRVVWTDYLPAEDVSSLLQQSALYLHLQDSGASFRSTALAAAMEHRLPIVAYRGRETEPGFVDDGNIRLVDPDDPRVLTSAVRQVLTDQALRRRLAEGAHVLWQQRCSWSGIAEATIASYRHMRTNTAWRTV